MPRVEINETNKRHCRCGVCPVLLASECVKTTTGPNFLHCATGKTECKDYDFGKKCMCPTCLVWDENNLKSVYYCENGTADEIN